MAAKKQNKMNLETGEGKTTFAPEEILGAGGPSLAPPERQPQGKAPTCIWLQSLTL
ncbi:hypothetical protein P7K49_025983, partial [Saguinus oedipus]